jgi:hypothetical protein
MAIAVRRVSWQPATPARNGDHFGGVPASLRRTASSMAISSNGFIDILTLAISTSSAVALDAHLDVVINDALYGYENFQDNSPLNFSYSGADDAVRITLASVETTLRRLCHAVFGFV